MSKTIEELSNKEIFEDIDHYLNYAQMQSPPFVDKTFEAIKKYIQELIKRGLMSEDIPYFEIPDKLEEMRNKISELELLVKNQPTGIELRERIEKLEKWNQNHLKFEHSAIADELLKHEKEISKLEKWKKDHLDKLHMIQHEWLEQHNKEISELKEQFKNR